MCIVFGIIRGEVSIREEDVRVDLGVVFRGIRIDVGVWRDIIIFFKDFVLGICFLYFCLFV